VKLNYTNMKWNWGTKLALAMAAFMIMVIVFVVLMFRESVDLVEKDYYPKGQAYQQQIDKKNNAAGMEELVSLGMNDGFVEVKFPGNMMPDSIRGEVQFYNRVTDLKDRFASLRVDSAHVFRYPSADLHGRYLVKIDWTYLGTPYYLEKSITIP